ncbi:MAG: membrane protein insertase YidC [Chitinophagales bacterium]|nr:membrane protein insertase YidC [Chitinophagales bacterium]
MEDKKSQLNTMIGMGLIFVLLFVWMQYFTPQPEQNNQNAQQTPPDTTKVAQQNNPQQAAAQPLVKPDSLQANPQNDPMVAAKFGAFAPASVGQEQIITLNNELVTVNFTSKGARIREIKLKNYQKINSDTANNDVKSDLYLLEDNKNRFEFDIPLNGTAAGKVNTSELYFNPQVNGNSVTFTVNAGEGKTYTHTYTLQPNSYQIDLQVSLNGFQGLLSKSELNLTWINHLDKLEKNQQYERTMSSVYYKVAEASTDYCDCRSNDSEALGDKPVQWFAHSNQFFNTAIVAQNFQFRQMVGETYMLQDADADLKILKTTAALPLEGSNLNMMIYSGPNEFDRLRAYDKSLEDIIPFGASLFGFINRWIIHPIFDVLSMLVSNKGIVILLLTLLVKMILYPLTYKMVHSQAKMSALKPRIEALRKKLGDDQQALSMETMKLYSEYKVNPLGGCLPIVLQMPIWFALYRFFPAAIEFRQASFLWATDLSSYDVMIKLPTYIWGFGNHLSAFTIIWVITTLWYTWYSMKQMDTAAMNNDQMKVMRYMQYFMPVMFMFFFNSFASGLTLYLCFSNLLNIGQTVATKRFLIDNEKISAQLEANKNKPRKVGGFRERLEQAMKEQQRLKDEQNKKKS